jgi:hypothetical protein
MPSVVDAGQITGAHRHRTDRHEAVGSRAMQSATRTTLTHY